MGVETLKESGRDSKRDKPQKDTTILLNEEERGFGNEAHQREEEMDYEGGDCLDNDIDVGPSWILCKSCINQKYF